jgi:two-component system, OmpR family, manganese sensing sensor histidine kinase
MGWAIGFVNWNYKSFMFNLIRRRLLLSYLLVLGTILAGFTIAVRFVFIHSLSKEMHEKLIVLGQGAASSLELDHGQINLKSDFPTQVLQSHRQGLEWFDLQGKSIEHQGIHYLTLPFLGQDAIQIQPGNPRIEGVTLPVMGSDRGTLLGYVRASQSLEDFDEAVRHLDWGMGGGIGIALALSGAGGFLLTRQAMQPIERSFEQLQQFTADASHELRSPLTAIQANAQVALRYPDGIRTDDAEKFKAIVESAKQMAHLTEDLLFLARTDILPQSALIPVNLTELLTNLVIFYQSQAIPKSIELQLEVKATLMTLGDAAQLSRLFMNLLDNALYHTPEGGQINIRSPLNLQHIEITVRDTGVGIAPEQLDRVFDRFWQADSSRSSPSGNCGLGLAIAKAIVQTHGGAITVSSKLGTGSCFTVRFPTYCEQDKDA